MISRFCFFLPLLLTSTVSFQSLTASPEEKHITAITFSGNTILHDDYLKKRIPYRVGEIYDESQSRIALEALYQTGQFNQVCIEKEENAESIELFISLEEKALIGAITFEGNNALSNDKLKEAIESKKITTINEHAAANLALKLQAAYAKEDYHNPTITFALTPSPLSEKSLDLTFTIEEGPRSKISTINFQGNTALSSRLLRSHLITGEDTLVGRLQGKGSYQKEKVAADHYFIQQLYGIHGYPYARVVKEDVHFSPSQKEIEITYYIDEGDQYTISSCHIDPDEEIPTVFLESCLQVEPGDIFNRELIAKSIENIKSLYGEFGYIDAEVIPEPQADEVAKTITLFFHVEKGKKWLLNTITITGNNTTHDHVIRRLLSPLEEGRIIKTRGLEIAKHNVERLGYFGEPGEQGVLWKKHRIGEGLADLELHVTEKSMRHFSMQFALGSGKNGADSAGGPSLSFNTQLKNIKGRGINSSLGLDTDLSVLFSGSSTTEKTIEQEAARHSSEHIRGVIAQHARTTFLKKGSFALSDPSLFRLPISGSLLASIEKHEYIEWHTNKAPSQTITQGVATLGTYLPFSNQAASLIFKMGHKHINSNNVHDPYTGERFIYANTLSAQRNKEIELLLDERITPGDLNWMGFEIEKNLLNHSIYPTEGYRLSLNSKIVLPLLSKHFNYYKVELESSWYTALIGTDSLVLGLHAKGGWVNELTKQGKIAYEDLFILGGAESVRGFNRGEVSPRYQGMPLGGKKAVQWNAELIFPLLGSSAIKGHIFYDAGCSWDTPSNIFFSSKEDEPSLKKNDKEIPFSKTFLSSTTGHITPEEVTNNTFQLRHSIGFGISMLSPQPMKISLGFKLDSEKGSQEKPYEFQITMNSAF